MEKKSIVVEVQPAVFKWLRESSGWTITEVAKRLQTSIRVVEDFEFGEKNPSLQ